MNVNIILGGVFCFSGVIWLLNVRVFRKRGYENKRILMAKLAGILSLISGAMMIVSACLK